VSEKLISKPPNVFGVWALSEPARGACIVPPNPVPELKRNCREMTTRGERGRREEKKKRSRGRREGTPCSPSQISVVDLDPLSSVALQDDTI